MNRTPIYFQDKDLPVVHLIAAKLETNQGIEIRKALMKVLTDNPEVKQVALPQTPMLDHAENHRGPDRKPRKASRYPKSIEAYILELKGLEVTAKTVIQSVKSKHKVALNPTSVGSILSCMWSDGKITKTAAPSSGYHSYLIKKPRAGKGPATS